jgi:DNA-damage-inducible protein D
MQRKRTVTISGQTFEALRQVNEHGAEYWSARALQNLLGYTQWRRFEQAIKRAITSCKESGNSPQNHFVGAGKMVDIGSSSLREIDDFHLSRFACYLIAQNGDPRKPEIAIAQQYFAIQTRRQELSDEVAADLERLELRKQTAEEFKALSGVAHDAGVHGRMFGVFHDAGYKGLYGGLGNSAIKQRKSIPDKDNLLDRMNSTELAANQFRMTQMRDKLAAENVHNQTHAIRAHEKVGREVRDAIKRIGGTLPENIPPAEHIKKVEKRLKREVPKLESDDKDATGLLGEKSKSERGSHGGH